MPDLGRIALRFSFNQADKTGYIVEIFQFSAGDHSGYVILHSTFAHSNHLFPFFPNFTPTTSL